MIDLTPIFQAVISLLAALITFKLIPWVKSKTTEKQQETLYAAARIAVYAAEQLYGAGQGDEKFQYVKEALEAAGFKLDGTLAYQAIENAVYQMNNSFSGVITSGVPPVTDQEDEAEKNAENQPEKET